MKKKIVFVFLVFVVILTSCAAIGMDNLPQGELIETVYSPDKTYKINSFLVLGNATVDFSVRCEVVEISSDTKRNIYWEYHCETADINWIDNFHVEINGKQLNVLTDTYDWRK